MRLRWTDAWHDIHFFEGIFWMRLSCVFALALTVIGLGAGANSAAALNVPPKVHRTKSSSQHLTTTRHSKTTVTRTSSTVSSSSEVVNDSSDFCHSLRVAKIAPYSPYPSPSSLLRTVHREFLCQGRYLWGRHHHRRRSVSSPGRDRRPGRHERHRRRDRSLQRTHSGDGQPEAGPLAGS